MIRPRGGPSSASSRATAQTLCQKCLKRDNYECKASTQERPYIPRPSRTQQLANPKLLPKLTNDAPNELLRKKGIADEELARKEAERRTARGREGELFTNGSRKRSRSLSSLTSTSVSTISTGISRSPSPFNGDKGRTGQSQRMSTLNVDRKRRRSGSSMSYSSRSSLSPPRRYGEHESSGRPYRRAKSRGRWSRSRSSSPGRRRNQRSRSGDRGKRRRRASRSPIDRGRHRDSRASRGDRRSKSLSSSRDRSQVIRNRKSMTPSIASKPPERLRHGRHRPSIDRNSSYSDDHERYGSSARTRNGEATATSFPSRRQEPPRERSLSPFSKRLALTQAMNMGR